MGEQIEPIDGKLAEVDGGRLANKTSVFLHLEQGLHKSPHVAAVVSTHQPANHLSYLVPVDHESEHQNGAQEQQHGSWQEGQSGVSEQPSGVRRDDCLRMTYTQVHRAALKLSAGMMANGAQPNSTVLTMIPNGGEYTIILWTCILMRLTIVSLDPSFLEKSQSTELQNAMRTLKPSLVVVPDATGAHAVDFVVSEARLTQPLQISLNEFTSKKSKSLHDLATAAMSYPLDKDLLLENARNDDPQRIHTILFTSGTSGQPKGCPIRVSGMTHVLHSQSWLIAGSSSALALQQAHNSRAIAPAQTLQTWREGGTVVMTGRGLMIEDTVDAILHYGITFLVLTPAMVHAMDSELASRSPKANSVQTFQIGGDAVTKDVLIRCAALFPDAKVCINHGMTEGGGSFIWPFFDTPTLQIPYFGELCPIGTVAPGSIVRIWDAERKRVLKRGESGELHICCDSIIPHYMHGASESSFYEDNKGRWFNTGDVAMIDKKGLVFILGRNKDVIKRAGVAIMPAVIESCLEKYTSAHVSTPRSLVNPHNFPSSLAWIECGPLC